jgi:hypothetical protein
VVEMGQLKIKESTWDSQGEFKVRSREVNIRSMEGQEKVKEYPWVVQGDVKERPWRGQEEVKWSSRGGQMEFKGRSRKCKREVNLRSGVVKGGHGGALGSH